MIAVTNIHCFLVHPSKNQDKPPQIGGADVPMTGQPFEMLTDVFYKSDGECRTAIAFSHAADGAQQNDCRDQLVNYVSSPGIKEGKALAQRLQQVTTNRSGLGLLFLITGQSPNGAKIVISRFPADQGILAEQAAGTLTVQFLEKVFMKSDTRYKAAIYTGDPHVTTDFWIGRAVDHQMNIPDSIADYWIREFLASDLLTTAAAGTIRFAEGLRSAIQKTTEPGVKIELAALGTLATALDGHTASAEEICRRYNLSGAATQAVRSALRYESLMNEEFRFDKEEFGKHIAFRTVELSNGAILTSEAHRFDEVFLRQQGDNPGEVRFETQGSIVNEKLAKAK